MITHITYSDQRMSRSAKECIISSRLYGCDKSYAFDCYIIDTYFEKLNSDILSKKRGAGYWLWKPYIILRRLLDANDDYILYTDAGVEIISNIQPLVDLGEEIVLFGNNYQHDHWCKRFITKVITGKNDLNTNQVQASAMLFRNTERSRNFVKEWLLWCQMPGFIDDSDMDYNHDQFKEHRHDQAILTCVAYNHNITLHWWPASYNNGSFIYDKGNYKDDYSVLFNHHRKRNDEW